MRMHQLKKKYDEEMRLIGSGGGSKGSVEAKKRASEGHEREVERMLRHLNEVRDNALYNICERFTQESEEAHREAEEATTTVLLKLRVDESGRAAVLQKRHTTFMQVQRVLIREAIGQVELEEIKQAGMEAQHKSDIERLAKVISTQRTEQEQIFQEKLRTRQLKKEQREQRLKEEAENSDEKKSFDVRTLIIQTTAFRLMRNVLNKRHRQRLAAKRKELDAEKSRHIEHVRAQQRDAAARQVGVFFAVAAEELENLKVGFTAAETDEIRQMMVGKEVDGNEDESSV